MERPRVSVILVSYNTRELLRRALVELSSYEVIVVDNASADGSAQMVRDAFPAITLIANSDNRGFGAANNQGIDAATGSLVLLLNSDAVPQAGAIDVLAEAMVDGFVAVGGKLVHPDGRLQESACARLTLWAVFCEQLFLERLFPRSRVFSPYWQSSRLPEGGDVEQVMGACLMMRPVERFDERFFLYCEDTELCFRLRRHGRIRYVPEAVFSHELGASSSSNRWRSVALYNRGKELYFKLHHGRFASFICFKLNRLGALLRVVAGLFVLPKAQLFWRVLFAPIDPDPRPR